MAIDITNVLDALQRKISSFDSSGDTFDLQYLLSSALRADRSSTIVYDTQQDLPDLLSDSDFAGRENLAYVRSDETVYFKDYTNRLWKPLPTILYYNVGSNYGFSSGGGPGTTTGVTLDRFPLVAPFTTSTDIGDLNPTSGIQDATSSTNSFTEGFVHGGVAPPGERVSKFNMINFTGSSTHITIPIRTIYSAGCSDLNELKGYNIAGVNPGPSITTAIHQYDFASTTPRALVGNTPNPVERNTGVSAATRGYWNGDLGGSTTIFEFPYSSSATVTSIGNLNPVSPPLPAPAAATFTAGNSSKTNGYFSGGTREPGINIVAQIEKFPFSAPFTNATDIGNLTVARHSASAVNSETEGFVSGGVSVPTSPVNTIDKFSFASDASAVDAGDLSRVKFRSGGHQY